MATISALKAAINQIAAERNLAYEDVIDSLCEAIKSNYQDYSGFTDNIDVHYSEKEDRIVALARKKVVLTTDDEAHEVPLIQAILTNPKAKIGEFIDIDVSLEGDFGRVAAASARNLLSQKVRDKEKDLLVKSFTDLIGTVQPCIVQRMDGKNLLLEFQKGTVYMDEADKIPNEFYKPGSKIKVYFKDVVDTQKGKLLRVSRSAPEFLKAVFSLEVPEIESKSIEIKAIAREAGLRSKVAVYSNVDTLDPLGSCIGQKGARINAIMDALKYGRTEERVDVILWDPNIESFVANSLSPAQTIKVKFYDKHITWAELDEMVANGTIEKIDKDKGEVEYKLDGFRIIRNNESDPEIAIERSTAKVIVPDDQLSLAIGKEGQNARLAAKATGVKIDIQGENSFVETNQKIDLGPFAKEKEELNAEKESETRAEEIKNETEEE